MDKKITTIDEYILQFDEKTQSLMQEFRSKIHEFAPNVTEKISWGMPTFYYHGNLVHFAAAKSHLGFYPGGEAIEVFKERLKDYKTSVGAIQFSYNKKIDYNLVKDIVEFRVKLLDEEKKLKENKK